jgi:hypothetical protein
MGVAVPAPFAISLFELCMAQRGDCPWASDAMMSMDSMTLMTCPDIKTRFINIMSNDACDAKLVIVCEHMGIPVA